MENKHLLILLLIISLALVVAFVGLTMASHNAIVHPEINASSTADSTNVTTSSVSSTSSSDSSDSGSDDEDEGLGLSDYDDLNYDYDTYDDEDYDTYDDEDIDYIGYGEEDY